MGAFISPCSLLAGWDAGLEGQRQGAELCSGGWKQGMCCEQGNELGSASPGAVAEPRSLGFSPSASRQAGQQRWLSRWNRWPGVTASAGKAPLAGTATSVEISAMIRVRFLALENQCMAGGGDWQAVSYSCPPSANRVSGKEKLWKSLFPRKTHVRRHAAAIYDPSEQCND